MFFSDKYFIEDAFDQAVPFNSIQEYNWSIAGVGTAVVLANTFSH